MTALPATMQEHLRRRFDVALAHALRGASDAVLVDHPSHHNVGDHMIWRAQMRALGRLDVKVRGVCEARDYDPARLARLLGPGTAIVQSGGGNLGDLYGRSQNLRERVLEDFPDRRIVQLPQSVEFLDPVRSARFAELARTHEDYLVMVRDARSLATLEAMELRCQLVPDAALTLPQTERRPPRTDVLWLRRSDVEAASSRGDELPMPHEVTDWTRPGSRRLARGRAGARRLAMRTGAAPMLWERRARREEQRGLRTLSRGRVVLTDRLHASVLAALAGIPAVTMADRYGKIEALRTTWGLDSVLPPLVADVDEARDELERLLAEATSR